MPVPGPATLRAQYGWSTGWGTTTRGAPARAAVDTRLSVTSGGNGLPRRGDGGWCGDGGVTGWWLAQT
ncbi:hypothetical protein [Streptomyces sp. NPDC056672]|uniref:hypothetical protein n=1 Tax=Streptomyces sp. NPDC056672 TaxID=3345906 RepID=UPI0036B43213